MDLRRRDPGVTARHGDRFHEVNSAGTAFRHLETAGPVDLAQNGEATLSVSDEGDVHLGTNQIILAVESP